jgi:hypothetical protein
MAKHSFSETANALRDIGKCLREGQLILSPFDQPIEEERRVDADQSDDNLNFDSQQNVCEVAEEYIPEYKKM